jgi:hypothetical protein
MAASLVLGVIVRPDLAQALGQDVAVQNQSDYLDNVRVSRETYEKLEQHIKENGVFRIDKNAYINDLKATSAITNQHYQGSHGLRWSYAQERHNEVQQHGYTYEQSLTIVSQELGHERADITEHYLR